MTVPVWLRPASRFATRHRLPVAIAACVILAILLTIVNVWLYVSSGASTLDLSRPGYENERKNVKESTPQHFEATGKLDANDIRDFKTLYDAQRKALNALGTYGNDGVMTDEALHLDGVTTPQ